MGNGNDRREDFYTLSFLKDEGSIIGRQGGRKLTKKGLEASSPTASISRQEEVQRGETSALCQGGDEQMEGKKGWGGDRRRHVFKI